MRKLRVRELMLVVAVVALALGWWLDRERLRRQVFEAERSVRMVTHSLARSEVQAKMFMRMGSSEAARRKRAEAALAECEERADRQDDGLMPFLDGGDR